MQILSFLIERERDFFMFFHDQSIQTLVTFEELGRKNKIVAAFSVKFARIWQSTSRLLWGEFSSIDLKLSLVGGCVCVCACSWMRIQWYGKYLREFGKFWLTCSANYFVSPSANSVSERNRAATGCLIYCEYHFRNN